MASKPQKEIRMGQRAGDGQRTGEPTATLPNQRSSWVRTMWRYVRRTLVVLLGIVLVIVGLVMLVTPGPAIVVIPVGLAMLGVRFDWLHPHLRRLRVQVRRVVRRVRAPRGTETTSDERSPRTFGPVARERVDSDVA
jgi:anti-sigma factor RsiW